MSIDLSFTQDQEWRKAREKQWQIALHHSMLREYTKKKIAAIKQYFFTGKVPDGESFGDRACLEYFPLKSVEGWNYVMSHLMEYVPAERKREGTDPYLNSLMYWIIGNMRDHWSFEEECNFFDWIMGEHLNLEVKAPVPVGREGVTPVHNLDPDRLFQTAMTKLFIWLDSVADEFRRPVWASRLDYLFELLPMIDSRVFDVEIHDRDIVTKSGIMLEFAQKRFQWTLDFMKNYPPEEAPAEAVAERQAFLDEFRQRLESLEPKPGQLQTLLDNLNA